MNNLILAPALEEEEFDDMGSFNHSLVQANLAYQFKLNSDYAVFIELSLDVSSLDSEKYTLGDEAKPDVCLYSKRPLSIPRDILRMTEMPLLAVEVLSPRQGTGTIIEKIEAYFALGIRSCWMVDPLTQTVHVYTAPTQRTTYAAGDVIDSTLDLQIPIAAIFE